MSDGSQMPPSQEAQSVQSVPAGGKGLGRTAIAMIVIVVVAVVIIGSVAAYLLFLEVADDIDDIGSYKYTEPVEYEYPAESYTALDVSNTNGDISVAGVEGATVIDIDGLKRAHTEADLNDFELVITEEDDTLVLEVIHHDIDWSEAMDLDITIPSAMTVRSASSVNGDVDVLGVGSVTNVESTNGNLEVEVHSVDGDMTITSTNGNIEVHILTSLDATLDMTTTNGNIYLSDVPLDLTVDESDHVSGTLNAGGYEIEIETTNGNINLRTLE